jgi:hypothetical protein
MQSDPTTTNRIDGNRIPMLALPAPDACLRGAMAILPRKGDPYATKLTINTFIRTDILSTAQRSGDANLRGAPVAADADEQIRKETCLEDCPAW